MNDILCKFGIHKWTKYGDAVKGYSSLAQFRTCKKCGKIGSRSFYGSQTLPDSINKNRNKKDEK